jgi:uncharacterized protein HemX
MNDQDTTSLQGPRSSGARGTAIATVLIVLALGIGAFVYFRHGEFAGSQTAAQSAAAPATVDTAAQQGAIPSIAPLKQSVADLQASQKQLSDQVTDLKRQLAAEQGERKMLSEQLGSLSGRVDSLSASYAAAPMDAPSSPAPSKRRTKSH